MTHKLGSAAMPVRSRGALLVILLGTHGGCASAGGTAGIFDIGSVWYKHPVSRYAHFRQERAVDATARMLAARPQSPQAPPTPITRVRHNA